MYVYIMFRKRLEPCTYVFTAGVTVLCVEGLKAVATVWVSILHDVALAAQRSLTLIAAEVFHVPMPALRLRTLISKDNLKQSKEKERERERERDHSSQQSANLIASSKENRSKIISKNNSR